MTGIDILYHMKSFELIMIVDDPDKSSFYFTHLTQEVYGHMMCVVGCRQFNCSLFKGVFVVVVVVVVAGGSGDGGGGGAQVS